MYLFYTMHFFFFFVNFTHHSSVYKFNVYNVPYQNKIYHYQLSDKKSYEVQKTHIFIYLISSDYIFTLRNF